MRKVERSEVVDYQTYAERRDSFRAHVLEEKAKRRIHVGEHLTFLFETTKTILYQIQEMMRLEQIVRERDIQHEIDTYNQLLGGDGELGCTLLIEVEDAAERAQKLRDWLALPEHLYVELADGSRVRAIWDPAQVGDTRLSSVQYLKFPVASGTPVALGCDHPQLGQRTVLTAEQRQALLGDLRAD